MKNKLKRFIVKNLIKILEWFGVDNTSKNELDKKEEVSLEKTYPQKDVNKKFFGIESLYDKVKEIELEIFPFKKYSFTYYANYKARLDKITKEIEKYYEEQESKDEIYLRILSGADYLIEIEKNLYNLLNEIKQYKKESFNYEMGMHILKSTKQYLLNVYTKIIGTSDINTLESAYKTLNCKLEEIYNLDIEDCTYKQEEMCKTMCECIYIFLKCNMICNKHCDISNFEKIFYEEQNVFWNILLENVTDLLNKIESFKNQKYYLKYEEYLRAILDKYNVEYSVLLNEKFLKTFVYNESKIIVLHWYYTEHIEQSSSDDKSNYSDTYNLESEEINNDAKTNDIIPDILESKEDANVGDIGITNVIDENNNNNNDSDNVTNIESQGIVKIEDLRRFLNNLQNIYKNDVYNLTKISLWYNLIYNFKYDITEYEVYKLVYFFGMKTFFITYLKNAETNDLMKKIFNSQKDVKVLVPRKAKNDEYVKVLSLNPKYFDMITINKILNKLSIHLKEYNVNENLTEFYCLAEFFEDCKLIMKNLNEI